MRRILFAFILALAPALALGGKVDLVFRDTPLAEALRLTVAASGQPVLLVEVPPVRVSLEAKGLPVEEVLNSLLSGYAPSHGYAELPGGLVVVAPKERLKELRPRELRVYEKLPAGVKEAFPGASFVDLGEGRVAVLATREDHTAIQALLEGATPLVSVRTFPVVSEEAASVVKEAFPGVSAQYVRASGTLVVRGDPRVLVEVRDLLAQSGLLGRAEKPSLEVFSLRFLSPDRALEALKGLVSEEALAALKPDANLRILYGPVSPEAARAIRAVLSLVDRPKKQVELLVRIEQVDEQKARSLGIDWQLLSGRISAALLNGSLSLGLDTAANEALKVVGALKAGENNGVSRTLVNTRLITLDGEGVKLASGGKLLLPQQIGGSGGNQPAGAVGYYTVDFGLTVDLTPVVAGEEILLKASVGLGGAPTSGPSGGVSVPSQNLGTNLRLKPGTTAVMGGVVTTISSESVQGVPLLSWIPLVGELFKTRQNSSSNSVILVFVSARPVEP